jgi:hypothetical protein
MHAERADRTLDPRLDAQRQLRLQTIITREHSTRSTNHGIEEINMAD